MSADKSKNLNARDDLLNLIVHGDPANSVSGLNSYFSLGSPGDLIALLVDGAATDLSKISDLIDASRQAYTPGDISPVVKRLVLDTVRGADLTRELVTELDRQIPGGAAGNEELFKSLIIFSDTATSEKYGTIPVNEFLSIRSDSQINSNEPTKDTPGLSAYIVKTIGTSPGTKNTAALTLFMNAIPTVHFSRAVPFLELTMQVGRSALTDGNQLNSPSQLKFILGAAQLQQDTADFAIGSAARGTLVENGIEEEDTAVAGMELFLSPQTMVPVGDGGGFKGINSPSLRPTDVLDPFRPLVSIDNVSIDVTASQGFMSFKTAKVEMTLYDRSRLSELADFVKPDLFSKTEFLLEYGWHHPSGEDYTQDPFGALLNAMRVREKYGIVNSSFVLEEHGTVKITLDLAMKGANEYRTTQTGEDESVQDALRTISDLQQRVSELRDELSNRRLGGQAATRGVLGSQVLQAAQSTLGTPEINAKQRAQLRNVISKLNSGASAKAKDLADTLTKLYGKNDGDGGAVKRLRTSLSSVNSAKFDALGGVKPSSIARGLFGDEITTEFDVRVDPFLQDLATTKLTSADITANTTKTSKYVSFGKVFMKFVAEPLAATKRFDDVQVLFYPFNSGAGLVRNTSIASFLIDRNELQKQYDTLTLERRSPGMSVGEFQNFINSTFFDNMANPSYGMATIYRRQIDKDGTVRFVPNSKKTRPGEKAEQKAATDVEAKLAAAGVPDGRFVPPHVDLYIESLPARSSRSSEGSDVGYNDGKTILRIHVFDKAASAYETQGELLRASIDSELNAVGYIDPTKDDIDDQAGMKAARNKLLAAAEAVGLIEGIPADETKADQSTDPVYSHFRIVGGPRNVKEFVMSTAPYIIYGAQNTAVTNLGLASIQDPALSTVNMLRTDRAGSITPEGSGRGGVPLKTIPAQLSIESLGCPLLTFMQQFFVDAGTGTDLDNIYAITQVNHNINASEFRSSFEMAPLQAFGKYESTINKAEQAIAELVQLTKGV